MRYKSIADLEAAVAAGVRRLAPAPDLVVGVPRSGLLAGFAASRALGRPLADLAGLREGRALYPEPGSLPTTPERRARVLVLDDCVNSGLSLARVRERLADLEDRYEFVVCAVYGPKRRAPHVDVVLERVPAPHVFEWNVLHHDLLARAVLDLDEVILGGGPLEPGSRPFRIPTKPIGFGVSRLPEARRGELEALLARHGIAVGRVLLGVEDVGGAYARLPSYLYLARRGETAARAAAASGKAALALDDGRLRRGTPLSPGRLVAAARARVLELNAIGSPLADSWWWKQRARKLLGEGAYSGLKRLARR